MLLGILRFIKGYVVFRAYGKSPERIMNICAQRGVRLWNARPVSDGLQACASVKEYRHIRPLAKRAGVVTKIRKKRGFPFFAAKYKGRIGLPAGAAAGIVLLIVLSQFLWTMNITGLKTVSEERLTALLNDSGVRIGAFKHGVDTSQARRDILLKVDEIGWLSVNICGCHADVEVKEKIKKPELEEDSTPCNLKAKTDGVITKVTAARGMSQVKTGSGVKQGDLLISGVGLTKQNTVRYVRAKGEVMADVISDKELKLDKKYDYISLSENKSSRYQLSFLGLDMPCSLSFRIFPDSVCTQKTDHLSSNGVALPLGIVTETSHELKKEQVTPDLGQAKAVFKKALLLYELFEKNDSSIVQKDWSVKESGGEYRCSASYVFNENIAESVDFSVEE